MTKYLPKLGQGPTYQSTMKAEGMNNFKVRIMPIEKIVSLAFHTREFSMSNLKADLKLLVAINSLQHVLLSWSIHYKSQVLGVFLQS
jgi:hypothetical protein